MAPIWSLFLRFVFRHAVGLVGPNAAPEVKRETSASDKGKAWNVKMKKGDPVAQVPFNRCAVKCD